MRTLLLMLTGIGLIGGAEGCAVMNMGAALAVSAVYRKEVRCDEGCQAESPWIGVDVRAECWVVEKFDLVRATTHDLDDGFWKYPGDFSRVSYSSLEQRLARFDAHPDPDDHRDPEELVATVVSLRPVVALLTPREIGLKRYPYPINVRTWADYDPGVRWFSPDVGVHPKLPIFESPDRALIDVSWGRLVLTRELVTVEDPAIWDDSSSWRWVVTTEPRPGAPD